MNCFNCLSLSSAPSSSVYTHRHKHQIWPTNKPPTLQLNGNNSFSSPLKTRALPPPIFFATAVPKAAKLSVLLQTGAVCLFAYWIANFVVPGIILKELESNDTNENGENSREDR